MSDDSKITSLSQEARIFNPPSKGGENAYVKNIEEYKAQYKRSMDDPEGYWADRTEELITWDKNGTKCSIGISKYPR